MFDAGMSTALLLSRDIAPATRFQVVVGFCLLVIALLWILAAAHRRRLSLIPIRIHVAGTRGKSTTVRLIAAAFRGEGYRVVAKVTGTEPRLILPDGTEKPIRRWGAATISEQRRFVAAAVRAKAEVFVAEAMAIQPEYLRALEHDYIKATDLVITNDYPDHIEQLGAAPDAMARALSHCIPPGGRVFLGADASDLVLSRAAELGCEVIRASGDPTSQPEAANLTLACAVGRQYGLADDIMQSAMHQATRDPGSFVLAASILDGTPITFANAFSCNDPMSFERLWRRHQPAARASAFLLNPRTDRPERTDVFLALLARLAPHAPLFIASRNPMLRRLAVAKGFDADRVHLIPARLTPASLRAIAAALDRDTLLWGVGNYRGAGAQITAILRGSVP